IEIVTLFSSVYCCVMAKLRKIDPRNRVIAYDDAAADDQVPQMGITRGDDRPNEWIVRTEIARMRQVEDRKIGKLAGSNHATILQAEHAGAIDRRPAHHGRNGHCTSALGGTHRVAGKSGKDSLRALDEHGGHASVPTSLSCQAPSANLDSPTMMMNRPTPASVISKSAANMR